MSNWSHLHWSMLSIIAEKLTSVPDHLAFSAVCSSWRSVALDIRPTFPCPLPILMIRGEDDYGYCISLSNKRLCKQKLVIPHEDSYLGTYGGWLVTVHKNLDMSLYNPFSRERLPLPSLNSVPKFGEGKYVINNRISVQSAAVSSSNINVSPKDLTVMISQGSYRRLAFAKPGDSSWQIIDNDICLYYDDIAFYKGKFYAVGRSGTVVCDISNSKVTQVAPGSEAWFPPYGRTRTYLLESQDGQLIMVERWLEFYNDWDLEGKLIPRRTRYKNISNQEIDEYEEEFGDYSVISERREYMTAFFTAYRMDFAAGKWVSLEGIGDQVFFLGFNSAFSLPAESGEGNRIYFTDDYVDGLESAMIVNGKVYATDVGIFNFSDRSVHSHIDIGAAVFYPPPMWTICLPW